MNVLSDQLGRTCSLLRLSIVRAANTVTNCLNGRRRRHRQIKSVFFRMTPTVTMIRLLTCFIGITAFLVVFSTTIGTYNVEKFVMRTHSVDKLTASGPAAAANSDVITNCSSSFGKPSLRYVTGSGIGNQMFAFASALGLSVSVGQRVNSSTNADGVDAGAWCVCIPVLSSLRVAFQPLSRWPTCDYDGNASASVNGGRWGKYNENLTSELIPVMDTFLVGNLQSWRYFKSIESQLRQLFRFTEVAEKTARQALESALVQVRSRVNRDPSEPPLVTVGVHVRRGNFAAADLWKHGFTVVNRWYLERAFDYMEQVIINNTSRQRVGRDRSGDVIHVVFVVVSNDMTWCRRNVPPERVRRDQVVFVSTGSTESDLAVLAKCNHTIMSTGSYSWWAAWLANGTAVFYENFPRPRSILASGYQPGDYYMPDWVGMM